MGLIVAKAVSKHDVQDAKAGVEDAVNDASASLWRFPSINLDDHVKNM